jgi:hypothetical protein
MYDPKVCLFLQVKAVGEEMGIGFLGLGFQPKWALSDIPIMPKVILSFNLGEGQTWCSVENCLT